MPDGIVDLLDPVADHDLNRGLFAWLYPIDGLTGGDALYDLCGRHHASLAAGTARPSWTNEANGLTALQFDGTNDALNSASAWNLTGVTLLTVSWWMYWNAFANDDDLAWESSTNFNSNAGGILCDPNESSTSGFVLAMRNSGATGTQGKRFTRPTGAAWHHYVATFDLADPSTWVDQFYIDGEVQSGSLFGGATGNPSSFGNYSWYFMGRGAASLFGAGRFTDFRLYAGRLLTATEARQLYDQSRLGHPDTLRRLRPPLWPEPEAAAALTAWFECSDPKRPDGSRMLVF
jgi:hypothetical protein